MYTYAVGIAGSETCVEASEDLPGDSVFYDSGLSFAKLLKDRLGESLDVVHYCGQDTAWLAEKAEKADCIVINTSVTNRAYNENSARLPAREKELCRMLLKVKGRKIVVSTGNPYAVRSLAGQDCTVFTYGLCTASLNAAVKGLTGEMVFTGKLPISLK